MRVVIGVLVVLHLLGAAAIIGPWLAAPRSGRIRMVMVWGARAQLVTGILLVGLHEMSSDTADPGDAGVGGGKAGGTATAVLPAAGLVQATALLAILNVCVAVLWT